MMRYTVHQLAERAGVSGRTLRYYDRIGLLKPSFVSKNGYRYYEEREVVLFKQILFFKELDFSLDEIRQIITSPDYDVVRVLKDQKKLLSLEKERLTQVIEGIDKTIKGMKSKKNNNELEFYGGLSKQKMDEYAKEVKAKYGDSSAYKQSVERTKDWKKPDYDKVGDDMNNVVGDIAKIMNFGPSDEEVQRLVGKYKRVIERFYDVTPEIFIGLADMYVDDARFSEFFSKFDPKLPVFMRDAIYCYCGKEK